MLRRRLVQSAGGAAPMDVGRAFRLELVRLGEARQRRAAIELLHHIGGLGRQRLGDLVVLPLLDDLILHFIEAAIPGRFDLGHFEPDKAAILGGERRIVDADIGGEDRAQQSRLFIQPFDGRAILVETVGVDGGNGALLKADGFGRLAQRLARTPARLRSCRECSAHRSPRDRRRSPASTGRRPRHRA